MNLADFIREKVPQEVVSFDGQTNRGTADKQKGLSGIHLMNAWSVDNKISLGQLKVDDKSNEIIAMPQLMDLLDLEGTIITADLNSRLRTYFTLRRELGNEYLHFLRFFLNHRRFMRSEYIERIGKSPAELLTGSQHKHWLKMLGFELFKKAA